MPVQEPVAAARSVWGQCGEEVSETLSDLLVAGEPDATTLKHGASSPVTALIRVVKEEVKIEEDENFGEME